MNIRLTLSFVSALTVATLWFVPDVSAQAPAAADGIELVEYVVVEGDTCTRIAQRVYGDRRRYDLIHSFNPEMGPRPHHLVAGTVLHLPRVAPEADSLPDARVTAVEREVTARGADADAWRDAHVGLDLYRGWRVTTEEESSAELTFADTSVLAMRADTLVIIFGEEARSVRRGGTEATLERGSLRTALGALRGSGGDAGGGSLQVSTPSARASLQGGSAVISVGEDGTSRVSAHVGDASVTGADGRGRTRVPEGSGSAVPPGGRPSAPQPLPPPPTWATGPRRFLGASGRGADVTGAWAPVAGARVYRVELSTGADGRGVVASTEVPASVTRFELHGLPPGSYDVHVSTIDGDFFESRPSGALAIEVVEAAFFVPGAAGSARFARLDPSVEPAPLEVAPGTTIALPEGVTCTMASGERVHELVVVGPWQAPACTDASGVEVALLALTTSTLVARVSPADAPHGARTPIEIDLGAPLPDDATIVVDGARLDAVERTPTGYRGVLDTTEPAVTGGAETAFASVQVLAAGGRVVLATTTVPLTAASSAPPPADAPAEVEVEAPPAEAPAGALAEAVGAVPFASTVGLTDFDVRGAVARASVAAIDDRLGGRARAAFDGSFTLADDMLRLGVGVPVDPGGSRAEPWLEGSGDLVPHVGFLALRRATNDAHVGLLVDVAIWAPMGNGGGVENARLMPSVELAWRSGGDLTLRTRQAGIFELADVGARLWASAYGLDFRVYGPLSLGLEAEVTVGEERGHGLVSAVAAVPTIVLDLAPVALHIGGRFGVDGSSVYGPAALFVTFRGAADF